jgi:hypothetical protein
VVVDLNPCCTKRSRGLVGEGDARGEEMELALMLLLMMDRHTDMSLGREAVRSYVSHFGKK